MSEIRLGTSAWSYVDWKGVLYPGTLPQTQWLAWYARFFNAVEVDSTFYHAPSPRVTAHWLDSTPESFRFTVKLSRVITHEHRLRDCGAPLTQFLAGLEPLRPKLGSVLVQLPPTFHPAHDDDALRRFVRALPREWPFAIEFRDTAWHHRPRVVGWLREAGVCWAWTDTEPYSHEAEGAFEWLPQTADFLYIRLLGDLGTKFHRDGTRRIERYDHLFWKRNRAVRNWAARVRHYLGECRAIHLFAANHFEGCSPMTAVRLARGLGLPNRLPDLETAPEPPDQLTLF